MMNKENEEKQEEPTIPNKEVFEFVKKLEIDSVKENSILVVSVETQEAFIAIIRTLGERYGKILKSKNVTVLAMGPNDKIEELDENDMAAHGWVRKQESRIIIPD